MKILFVSVAPLQRELGASKVVIEVGEEMERLGWECRWTSMPELLGGGPKVRNVSPLESAEALRAHLKTHGGEYDVVDYGVGYLPFPRREFAPQTLFVARSVLLIHHFNQIKPPAYPSWKARAHALVHARRNRAEHREIVGRVDATIAEADLVNVANQDDRTILRRQGVPDGRIVVIPYGLSRAAIAAFERTPWKRPAAPTIAFVGTFDSRKGAADFPNIARRIVARVPESRFLLVGTYRGEDEVRSRFPSEIRSRIAVVPQYKAEALPELLSGCSVGVFPSYIEAFGFGVLEMLAAGLPVIAYAAPGPPVMLPPRYLVDLGDAAAMGDKVVELLRDEPALATARSWAKERSRAFQWQSIARLTSDLYREHWERNRGRTP
jgi:glycosyltransferase involved in cell wall biosynthesis